MTFETSGVPIHTRALQVSLDSRGPGRIGFDARILDLRKRGIVPVGGDLQPSGIVHQMAVEGEIDARSGAIARIAALMPSVAFEPSATTRGETCRDTAGRVSALAGVSLGDGFARGVGAQIGGPRGCSHVLTLVHLLGPTAAWAIARDRERLGDDVPRRDRERFYRRDVVIDGHATPGGGLELVLQATDLHLRPAAEIAASLDRFAAQDEVRVFASMSMPGMAIDRARVADRRRTPRDIGASAWRDRPERAAQLDGLALRAGATAHLLRAFDPPGDDRPLLDALLMLAPAVIQCFASYPDDWRSVAWGGGETGGLPDSCWMWRTDGPLALRRAPGSA